MLSMNFFRDAFTFLKATLSNQLARFAPSIYIRLTHQTGRGRDEDDILQVSNYFIQCFHDYREQIGLSESEFALFLNEKSILEYGPGDILGVALLMYSYGAKEIHCVDKFPMLKFSKKNIKIYTNIISSLDDNHRRRAATAFIEYGKPESGFSQEKIRYNVTESGLSGELQKYDFVISRAVLEHVNNLDATFLDISKCLNSDGISIHQVDLKSHGLDRYKPFDFLTWPNFLYKLMYSHKGFPNRWRVNKYIELAQRHKLHMKKLIPTEQIALDKDTSLKLAKEFVYVPVSQLSWTGFWMILEH
jgi:hypothetical protein